MNKVQPVSVEEFLQLVKFAQSIHRKNDEPIPILSDENIDKVDSCLKSPFQTFGGKQLYKSFNNKAAILFYLLIKNHPLQNGNKRMACLAVAYFSEKNGRNFSFAQEDLYELAKAIAMSIEKEKAIQKIETAFAENIFSFKK